VAQTPEGEFAKIRTKGYGEVALPPTRARQIGWGPQGNRSAVAGRSRHFRDGSYAVRGEWTGRRMVAGTEANGTPFGADRAPPNAREPDGDGWPTTSMRVLGPSLVRGGLQAKMRARHASTITTMHQDVFQGHSETRRLLCLRGTLWANPGPGRRECQGVPGAGTPGPRHMIGGLPAVSGQP
jgi:hypothetical protein